MPRPRIIHASCHYKGQWLPGDPRGFRSRDHKIHSSGDYKNPPPAGEHAGLYGFSKSLMLNAPIALEPEEYPILGTAFLNKLHSMELVVYRLACGRSHVHYLYESVAPDAFTEMACAKQYASHQLKTRWGGLWAKRGKIVDICDINHLRRVLSYIPDHAEKEGAWIWVCEPQLVVDLLARFGSRPRGVAGAGAGEACFPPSPTGPTRTFADSGAASVFQNNPLDTGAASGWK
jgi:hypothetical protein